MNVADDLYTFPSLKPMELTTAFPPLHSLMINLSKVDYKKHLNTFMDTVEIIILTIAAVSVVLYQRFMTWYNNGGKEMILQTIENAVQLTIKVWNFLSVCYTWVRTQVYPQLIKFVDSVIETVQAFRALVTVA